MTTHSLSNTSSAVDPNIVADIKRASREANVDFGYMMAQARQESSFQPDAKASTSSATGLYQFIDTTWLRAVKLWGDKHGMGQYAAQITLHDNGDATVSDPAVKQQILNLRTDPAYSASLAAELAHANKAEVERSLGRAASPTDLYLAHFLGAKGASDFVHQIQTDGSANAAALMPQAAEANRAVFYDDAGKAKTVAQIYQSFATKIEGQISRYASATGVDSDTAAEAVALNPIDTPRLNSQNLLATMNVLALTALKMLGRSSDEEKKREAATEQAPYRHADTSA